MEGEQDELVTYLLEKRYTGPEKQRLSLENIILLNRYGTQKVVLN